MVCTVSVSQFFMFCPANTIKNGVVFVLASFAGAVVFHLFAIHAGKPCAYTGPQFFLFTQLPAMHLR